MTKRATRSNRLRACFIFQPARLLHSASQTLTRRRSNMQDSRYALQLRPDCFERLALDVADGRAGAGPDGP